METVKINGEEWVIMGEMTQLPASEIGCYVEGEDNTDWDW